MEITQEAVKERVKIVLDLGVKASEQVKTATHNLVLLSKHLGQEYYIKHRSQIRRLQKADQVQNEALHIAAEEIRLLRKRVAELEDEIAKLKGKE